MVSLVFSIIPKMFTTGVVLASTAQSVYYGIQVGSTCARQCKILVHSLHKHMWMQELIHTQDDIVPLKSHKIVIFIDDEKGNEESIEMEWLKLDKPNKVITDGSSPHLSVHIEDFDQDLNELSTSNLKTLSKEQIEKLKEKIEIIRQRLNLSEQVAEVP